LKKEKRKRKKENMTRRGEKRSHKLTDFGSIDIPDNDAPTILKDTCYNALVNACSGLSQIFSVSEEELSSLQSMDLYHQSNYMLHQF
jgi:hypothetical protein